MNKYYYIEKPILSEKIQEYASSSNYSEIRVGNKTTKERILNSTGSKKIEILDNLEILNSDLIPDEILVFTSTLFSKNLDNLIKFIAFGAFSMINTFWGHDNCFVYKGNKNRLISYLKEHRRKDIYFVNFPEFIIDLTSLPQLKSLLSNNHDSRHFNNIKSQGDLYIKKSLNSDKLKTEFEFLANIPKELKQYYVEVFDYHEEKEASQYSMVSYDYKDVSHQYLSNSLGNESFQKLMELLLKFFKDSARVSSKDYKKNSFESLLKKNNERNEKIKQLDYYKELNFFLLNFKGISIDDHYERIANELKKRKRLYYEKEYIFSHGDLCYSNILFSDMNMEIKLIDPKGYENNGMRSPYYDMAKLSHSIFGNYDLIINNMAKIDFDEHMGAQLVFSKNHDNKDFIILYENLISKMKMDLKLIRLIESSLFLSMIPFHYENKRKAFMLCLRSVELFEDFLGQG